MSTLTRKQIVDGSKAAAELVATRNVGTSPASEKRLSRLRRLKAERARQERSALDQMQQQAPRAWSMFA